MGVRDEQTNAPFEKQTQASKLLVASLKQLNVKIAKLEELDSQKFIQSLIGCFQHISAMLDREDNFIDIKFLKSQNVAE